MIEVNDYITFNKSIKNEKGHVVYGSGGAGIVTRINKGKKTVKNIKGDVLGKHSVCRVYAGAMLGMVTAIVDDGEWGFIGKQEVLHGVGYGEVIAIHKRGAKGEWDHL